MFYTNKTTKSWRTLQAIEEEQGWKSVENGQFESEELNNRLMMAERAFTGTRGFLERHGFLENFLIYGPLKQNDYGSKSFPGVDDAIQNARS
ncbi:Transferrin receptor-like, dimerization domain [Dillenia turbinata]|uniref:Transferrin receptor-like, dimerization domain n=1 Tax=Dillenia turbinata TaxID=194707 RepID=A0AAN8W2I5_9MAGN